MPSQDIYHRAAKILIQTYHSGRETFDYHRNNRREEATGRAAMQGMEGLATLDLQYCEDGEDPRYSVRLTEAGWTWVEDNAPKGTQYTLTPEKGCGLNPVVLGVFGDPEEAKAKARKTREIIQSIEKYANVRWCLSRRQVVLPA